MTMPAASHAASTAEWLVWTRVHAWKGPSRVAASHGARPNIRPSSPPTTSHSETAMQAAVATTPHSARQAPGRTCAIRSSRAASSAATTAIQLATPAAGSDTSTHGAAQPARPSNSSSTASQGRGGVLIKVMEAAVPGRDSIPPPGRGDTMGTMYSRTSEPVRFERDCPAVLVPQGDSVTLPVGSAGYITQALGGSYTVFVEGNLFRIAGRDADAIGKEIPPPIELPEGADEHAVEKLVWAQLRTCFDPEIPINVVDLGLVYEA